MDWSRSFLYRGVVMEGFRVRMKLDSSSPAPAVTIRGSSHDAAPTIQRSFQRSRCVSDVAYRL